MGHPDPGGSDDDVETMPALTDMAFEEGVRFLTAHGESEDAAREMMAIALGLSPGDAVSIQELERWARASRSRRRRSA